MGCSTYRFRDWSIRAVQARGKTDPRFVCSVVSRFASFTVMYLWVSQRLKIVFIAPYLITAVLLTTNELSIAIYLLGFVRCTHITLWDSFYVYLITLSSLFAKKQ